MAGKEVESVVVESRGRQELTEMLRATRESNSTDIPTATRTQGPGEKDRTRIRRWIDLVTLVEEGDIAIVWSRETDTRLCEVRATAAFVRKLTTSVSAGCCLDLEQREGWLDQLDLGRERSGAERVTGGLSVSHGRKLL
jgi:hypothetical protein